LLALLTALFFWLILTPNLADRASFPAGDFTYQFWAFATFEARELSAGRLPLWNPYTYAGAPFWADVQSAVLYPPSLLMLLLSGLAGGFSLFALELEAILHFWLAGMFTYLFTRRLTRHRGAALLAAITFAFGGYLTGYPSQQLAVLETNAWLPLLLFFADRALLDRSGTPRPRLSWPDTLAAGLAWGIALLAGHPQSAMFLLYTFLLYVIFLLLAYRRRPAGPSANPPTHQFTSLLIPHLLVALLVGFGLAAVAWLPALEYMRLSVRAAGFYDKMSGGFPLHDLIQMLLPGSVSFYSPLYVGVLPLLLALWAALALRRRETIFWGVLAAAALLLSLGGETFLYTPFYLCVPGFGIFRDQERAAFLVSFALAVLAGYGFKYQIANRQIINRQINKSTNQQISKSPITTVVGWLMLGALALVVLFFYALNNAGWRDDSPFNLLLRRSVWLALMLALAWAVLKLEDRGLEISPPWTAGQGDLGAKRTPHTFLSTLQAFPKGDLWARSPLLATCCLLLAAFDLFSVNWQTNVYPSPPEAHTAVPAVVQAIRQDAAPGEVFRVYNEYRIYENYGVPYDLEDAWGASPLRLARYDELYRSLRIERVWQLLNVKYVITWRKELYVPSDIIYQEAAGDEVTYVHRLEQVSPRAWWVYRAQEVSEDEVLVRLDAFDFDPAGAAIVSPGTSLTMTPPPDAQHGQIHIVSRTPGTLRLDATTPTDGLLMLSEVHYPGWRATVDGQPVPILRADYILRGVPVPAGGHRVELVYQPLSFIWGAVISGITLLALVAAGLWFVLARRGQQKS
jgi:hypothetical protein